MIHAAVEMAQAFDMSRTGLELPWEQDWAEGRSCFGLAGEYGEVVRNEGHVGVVDVGVDVEDTEL